MLGVTATLAGMVIAWVLLAVFKGHLVGMAVGLIVLDIGATVVDILNRTILNGLNRLSACPKSGEENQPND